MNSQWDSAFEGQFIIGNTGKENLENWKFQVTFSHEITSLWDGMGMGQKLDYRAGAEKYMVLLTDEKCNPVNRYGIKDLTERGKLQIIKLPRKNIVEL